MVHRSDENIYNSVIKSTVYSENQAVELAILGSISMAVTLINVICIYGAGILFLKVNLLFYVDYHQKIPIFPFRLTDQRSCTDGFKVAGTILET